MASANVVITLSEDMRQTVLGRGIDAEKPVVSNNFILDSASSAIAPPAQDLPDGFRFIFAGNIGNFQGVEELLEAFSAVAEPEAELLFMGAGALTGLVREAAQIDPRIKYYPHRPLPEAMGFIATADVAIVSLAPGVIRSAFPSKLMIYLELGCRTLAIVESDSELAQIVETHKLGAVAQPGDSASIAQAMHDLIRSPRHCSPEDTQITARRLFGRDVVLEAWTDLYLPKR